MSVILSILGTESRTTFRNPADWLYEALVGAEPGGITVNSRTATTLSSVWRAITLVSGDVAKLPLFVYMREGEGKRRAPEHPAYRLLRYQSAPAASAFILRRSMQAVAMLTGNAYAYIDRRGDDAPVALVKLDEQNTWPTRENGVVVYKWRSGPGEKPKTIPATNILHIRGLGDDLEGVSVVKRARDSMGLGIAAQKYGLGFFNNGARPGGVLEHPAKLGDQAAKNLRESWKGHHGGLDKVQETAILEEGMKYHAITVPPEDAQFLQTREFSVRDVANWFGVPPHKVGDPTRTSYGSLEQEEQSYLDEGLDPWLVTWESECRLKLLTVPQQQRDTHLVEFLRQALVRANMRDRHQAYHAAVGDGWMSRNEVRARENLNPIAGLDEMLAPLNMAPTDEAQDTEPPPQEDEDDARHDLLMDVLSRMARRLSVHAVKAAKTRSWPAWLNRRMVSDHLGVLVDAIDPVARVISEDVTGHDIARRLMDQYRAALLDADKASAQEVCKRLEADLPGLIADEVLKEMSNANE